MADLTAAEQRMFGKWWGIQDLHLNGDFWTEVLLFYQDKNVPLPVEHNPYSARRILDMLDCPPGKCGLCCRYEQLPVDAADLKRIADKSERDMERLGDKVQANPDGTLYISCSEGCPFLVDNTCSIYEYRPSTCYFFPLNTPRMATLNGREFQQAMLRIKCPSSVNIVRALMCESLANGGTLLPDLSLIPPCKEEQ